MQEKALRQHSASSVEMVLYSYSIGMVYIFIGTFLSGSLLPAFQYCLEVSRAMGSLVRRGMGEGRRRGRGGKGGGGGGGGRNAWSISLRTLAPYLPVRELEWIAL